MFIQIFHNTCIFENLNKNNQALHFLKIVSILSNILIDYKYTTNSWNYDRISQFSFGLFFM